MNTLKNSMAQDVFLKSRWKNSKTEWKQVEFQRDYNIKDNEEGSLQKHDNGTKLRCKCKHRKYW